jgi:hypothetical protein
MLIVLALYSSSEKISVRQKDIGACSRKRGVIRFSGVANGSPCAYNNLGRH